MQFLISSLFPSVSIGFRFSDKCAIDLSIGVRSNNLMQWEYSTLLHIIWPMCILSQSDITANFGISKRANFYNDIYMGYWTLFLWRTVVIRFILFIIFSSSSCEYEIWTMEKCCTASMSTANKHHRVIKFFSDINIEFGSKRNTNNKLVVKKNFAEMRSFEAI